MTLGPLGGEQQRGGNTCPFRLPRGVTAASCLRGAGTMWQPCLGHPEEVVTSFPAQTQKEPFLQGSHPIFLSRRLLGRNHMTELSRASLPIFLEMTLYCEAQGSPHILYYDEIHPTKKFIQISWMYKISRNLLGKYTTDMRTWRLGVLARFSLWGLYTLRPRDIRCWESM